ncbi:FmdB family zinc ribbon protein [Lacunimicrobium album]|jgi:putative FmdB family regulatory protein
MPIYEYQTEAEGCEFCQHKFEELQKISDEPLTKCPQCGGPVARTFSAFAVTGMEKQMMSNKNLEEKGFTKYVKAGDGYYEKQTGKGPQVIRR